MPSYEFLTGGLVPDHRPIRLEPAPFVVLPGDGRSVQRIPLGGDAWRYDVIGPDGVFRCPDDPENSWPLR